MSKYGTVKTTNGVYVTLQQDAYISSNGEMYEAHGTDDQGNDYQVTWAIKEFDDGITPDDESEMCDWDIYTVRQL